MTTPRRSPRVACTSSRGEARDLLSVGQFVTGALLFVGLTWLGSFTDKGLHKKTHDPLNLFRTNHDIATALT